MNNEEVIYSELKKLGQMDKDDVMEILNMDINTNNIRKATGYMKRVAKKYDETKHTGKKTKNYR